MSIILLCFWIFPFQDSLARMRPLFRWTDSGRELALVTAPIVTHQKESTLLEVGLERIPTILVCCHWFEAKNKDVFYFSVYANPPLQLSISLLSVNWFYAPRSRYFLARWVGFGRIWWIVGEKRKGLIRLRPRAQSVVSISLLQAAMMRISIIRAISSLEKGNLSPEY